MATHSHAKGIGHSFQMQLWAKRGAKHVFRAQVRSSTRMGFRRHRIGIVFVALTPEQRSILTEFGSRAGAHEFGWSKAG